MQHAEDQTCAAQGRPTLELDRARHGSFLHEEATYRACECEAKKTGRGKTVFCCIWADYKD